MKKIVAIWEISDFCSSYGRIIPHFKGNSYTFSEFHCSHLEDVTIVCSESNKNTKISYIISMSGYVVKFLNEDNYLFCTSEELENLKKESELVEEKATKETNEISSEEVDKEIAKTHNPARPYGVAITKEIQVTSHNAYSACTEYPSQLYYFHHLLQMRMLDFNMGVYVCKEDCLFPKCPFYSIRNVFGLANHPEDYDDWIDGHY